MLLAVMAILLTLGVAELVLHVIKPVYDFRDRSLLFSSPVFKEYSGGAIRYFPKTTIREVAIYNGKLEYDVIYPTNNLGFIDTKDYVRKADARSCYAFVGDSFTAGVNGGTPWVPKLRNDLAGREVYNFGVCGAGFNHFYLLMHDMKDKVKITHIAIVAITDDFYRSYWHSFENDGMISFCSENYPHKQCLPKPVAGVIPLNATKEEVRAISRSTYKEIRRLTDEENLARGYKARLEALLYDDSIIYYYARVLLDSRKRQRSYDNIDFALGSLRKIRAEYPQAEIHLIHLPQKYEIMTKNYSINIAEQVKQSGVKYFPALEKCNWSLDMFFERDGHPNSTGYDNIAACVSGYLFGNETVVAPKDAVMRKP